MANTIIIIGILLVLIGFGLKYVLSLRGLPSDIPSTKENKALSNKEKGNAFESFVIKKVASNKIVAFVSKASDHYGDGIYPPYCILV